MVSLPKEEKVVKPPRTPINTSALDFRGKYAACFGKLREEANHETTDEIDRQRAVGEVDALADGLSPRAEKVSGRRNQWLHRGRYK